MARQVVLDTETTGLYAKDGDRIVEIGCVEILNRRVSEHRFHTYIDPERDIDEGASRVHGLTRETLQDEPKFAAIAAPFLDFVRDAELIIHNASFDLDFLDMELRRLKLGKLRKQVAGIIDTLAVARELHPGKKNSLDALCERYGIDNSNRTLHGALLDARLLAECYLAMTRGQESLVMDLESSPAEAAAANAAMQVDVSKLMVQRASPEENAVHEKYLDGIDRESGSGTLWRRAD